MAAPLASTLFPDKPTAWSDPQSTIKKAVGGNVRFTSGTRTPQDNARVGGSRTSSHLTGNAQDFVPNDGDTATAARKLAAAGVPYDQIIDEGDHVHVGYDPRMRGQVLAKPGALPRADALFAAPLPDAGSLFPSSPAAKPAAARVATPVAKVSAPARPTPTKRPNLLDTAVSDYQARVKRATDMLKQGAADIAPPQVTDPEAIARGVSTGADPLSSAKGVLGLAGGAFSLLAAPITGAIDTVTGPAFERAGSPRTAGGDIAEIVGGFLVPGAPKATRGARLADTAALEAEAALAKPLPAAKPLKPAPVAKAPAVASAKPVAAKPAARPAAPVAEELFPDLVEAPVKPAAKPTKAVAAATDDPLDDVLFAPGQKGPRTLKPGVFPEEAAPKGVPEHLADAAGAVQKILAPATVGLGRDAALTLRRASSEADLQAAQAGHTLMEHTRKVDALSTDEKRALVSYIEGRSVGAKLEDPALQTAADDLRKVNESYRQRIQQVMGEDDGPSFIEDYYSHLWKEAPNAVAAAMGASKQGSGRSLKARSIPTLQEGIEAGLTPVSENPIEVTMNYANNMSRYLATIDAQSELAANGYSKFATPGQQPSGWVPLNGIRTSKPGRTILQDGEVIANKLEQKLYAPPDVARVYNNWISKGFEQGDLGPLFEGARKAANGMTMLKLGFSAFHAMTMVQESMVSEMARGVQAMSRAPGLAAKGKLSEAGKALSKGAGVFSANSVPGVGMLTRTVRGNRMRHELLSDTAPDSTSKVVNDAFIRSGGRVRMDPLYRTRGSGSFYNAVHKGTFKTELTETARRIFGGGGPRVADRAAGIVDLGANLIQSFSAPLFESWIPRLKQGAFASTMEDWLAANPGATQRMVDEAATEINRSIDNRFGEMAWDNLFWNQQLKQTSRLLLLSPTWNMGTINEIGGGLVDILGPSFKGVIQGKGVTPRTAYIAAGVAQVAMMNGIMTYLKTGEAPEGMDFAAYRTGGTDARSGEPERAMTPGYQKDVYAFLHDFPNHIGQEVQNKLNPALKTALELAGNKDFRGLPITAGEGAVPGETDKGMDDYLLEAFMPISFSAFMKGQKEGSNISPVEQNLAIRAAPSYLTAPEQQKQFKEQRNRKEWQRKVRADNRAENMRQKD